MTIGPLRIDDDCLLKRPEDRRLPGGVREERAAPREDEEERVAAMVQSLKSLGAKTVSDVICEPLQPIKKRGAQISDDLLWKADHGRQGAVWRPSFASKPIHLSITLSPEDLYIF
jgi:hypothetical protein